MRILFALSLFLYFNLSGFVHISERTDITLLQQCDEIKGNSEIPFQSSQYDSPCVIELDEDSDFNEAFINCTFTVTNVEFRVSQIIPIFRSNLNLPNLITFGTDNSPPVS